MGLEALPFGAWAGVVIGAYLVGLLLLGWLGRRASREKSMGDFYQGGSGLGLWVLFLTLYATQYSSSTCRHVGSLPYFRGSRGQEDGFRGLSSDLQACDGSTLS